MNDKKSIIQLLKRAKGNDLDFKSSPILLKDIKHKNRFIKNLIT